MSKERLNEITNVNTDKENTDKENTDKENAGHTYQTRETLKKMQKQYLAEKNWAQVKAINHTLMEMDLAEKCDAVSYFPPKILVEHTNLCNAQCIMCSHFYTNNFGRGFIEDEIIRKLEEILPYVDKVLLHGIGEPFIHPHIQDYIRLYRSYGAEVSCNTNMSIMNDELAACIRDCFDQIVISCDSPKKETFEQIRRKVSFDDFCRNVRTMRAAAPNLVIRMNVVAMRQNIRELPGLIPFAEELGINEIAIMDLTAQKLMENECDEIRRYPVTAKVYLEQTKEAAEQSKVKLICIPEHIFRIADQKIKNAGGKEKLEELLDAEAREMVQYPQYPDETAQKRMQAMYQKLGVVKPMIPASDENVGQISGTKCEGICNNFADTPFLSPEGKLFSCCIDGVHVYGDLKEASSFAEIWNNDIYRQVRRNFHQGNLPKFCKACSFLKGSVMSRIRLTDVAEDFYENEFSKLLGELAEKVKE